LVDEFRGLFKCIQTSRRKKLRGKKAKGLTWVNGGVKKNNPNLIRGDRMGIGETLREIETMCCSPKLKDREKRKKKGMETI